MSDPNEPPETPTSEPATPETVAPEPAAPEPAVSAPEPASQPASPLAPDPLGAPVPAPPPIIEPRSSASRRRRRRDVEEPSPYGAGDFDAVFEGRSAEGLGDRLTPTICYLLMIIAPLGLGLPAVPAAIIAWMARRNAPDWLRTHYLYQLRSFTTGAVLASLALVTEVFGQTSNVVGVVAGAVLMLLLVAGVAWFVLRSVIGLGRLRRGEPCRYWRTWLF